LLLALRLASKIGKKMQQLQKAELAVAVKEDLKTVALGTSKINYMDPRITIAWCKRNEVRAEGARQAHTCTCTCTCTHLGRQADA